MSSRNDFDASIDVGDFIHQQKQQQKLFSSRPQSMHLGSAVTAQHQSQQRSHPTYHHSQQQQQRSLGGIGNRGANPLAAPLPNANSSSSLHVQNAPSLSYMGGDPSGSSSSPSSSKNFKVVIRVRPPLPREIHGEKPFQPVVHVVENREIMISENLQAHMLATGAGTEEDLFLAGKDDKDTLYETVVNPDGSVKSVHNSALVGPYSMHRFTFDHVYDQYSTQEMVYANTAKAVVDSSLRGYNATIFAYGQTGTGKTYTMEGFNSQGTEQRGIIPRAIEQIFGHIRVSGSSSMRFLVRASYLQIYNEVISDLLKPDRNNLSIREDKRKGVFVEGLSEWVVRTPQEIYGLMQRGGERRATGSTKMNEMSSRSHAVFIIIAEQSETTYVDNDQGKPLTPQATHALLQLGKKHLMQMKGGHHHDENIESSLASAPHPGQQRGGRLPPQQQAIQQAMQLAMQQTNTSMKQSFRVGKLNLVDLAGSERVRISGATGQRLEESKKINQSLSALGNVIAALTDPKGRQHIPYRDSKLTRILEESMGGNCKTTMMAMISPAFDSHNESLSTLKFANRAKNIKNEARINEDLDQKSLLRKYEREVKRLRNQLADRNRNIVDKRRILELDEQRRRAEEDKIAALRALEARSIEFLKEKEKKKELEERIGRLQGQMLMGGGGFSTNGTDRNGQDNVSGRHSLGGDNSSKDSNSSAASQNGSENDVERIRAALKEQRDKIRKEYEAKLLAVEKERQGIAEEKAQVDRYKQLLLKQRDIMIALTQRLNERDEQIMALQDELDAYDTHQKELEEKLDEKTAALIHLQRVTMEHNESSPVKNEDLVQALGEWADTTKASSSNTANLRNNTPASTLTANTNTNETVTLSPYNPGYTKPYNSSSSSGNNQAVMVSGMSTPELGSSSEYGSDDDSHFQKRKEHSDKANSSTHIQIQVELSRRVKELSEIVEKQKKENVLLQSQWNAINSEKDSLETLLREKLEYLVQSEMEKRLKGTGATVGTSGGVVTSVRSGMQGEENKGDPNNGGGDHLAESLREKVAMITEQHERYKDETARMLSEKVWLNLSTSHF
eukprot:g1425.t1